MFKIVPRIIIGLIVMMIWLPVMVEVIYAQPVPSVTAEQVAPADSSTATPPTTDTRPFRRAPPIILMEPIGGQQFTMPEREEGYSVKILEAYLAYLYPYAVAVIASLAVLMTVLGALQITTAGGDSAKVGEGKDRILYAIGGLVLLLMASLILWTINPTFFQFLPT
jgi:hypothetical protein